MTESNDKIRLAMQESVNDFADAYGQKNVFTAAYFSQTLARLSGAGGFFVELRIARSILDSRADVEPLPRIGFYKLLDAAEPKVSILGVGDLVHTIAVDAVARYKILGLESMKARDAFMAGNFAAAFRDRFPGSANLIDDETVAATLAGRSDIESFVEGNLRYYTVRLPIPHDFRTIEAAMNVLRVSCELHGPALKRADELDAQLEVVLEEKKALVARAAELEALRAAAANEKAAIEAELGDAHGAIVRARKALFDICFRLGKIVSMDAELDDLTAMAVERLAFVTDNCDSLESVVGRAFDMLKADMPAMMSKHPTMLSALGAYMESMRGQLAVAGKRAPQHERNPPPALHSIPALLSTDTLAEAFAKFRIMTDAQDVRLKEIESYYRSTIDDLLRSVPKLRPALRWFVGRMEAAMGAKDIEKGQWSWRDGRITTIFDRDLVRHVGRLAIAVRGIGATEDDRESVCDFIGVEAVHIANLSMMIADIAHRSKSGTVTLPGGEVAP